MPRPQLLALDLDGTLYRSDGTISPWDVEAVAQCRDAGITVTLATGRIAHGALPAARALGLTGLFVCAEGAALVDAVSGEVVLRHVMHDYHVEAFTETAGEHGLASFWFLHDAVHGEAHGADHMAYIGTWSPSITLHTKLTHPDAWTHRRDVTMMVAIGGHDEVKAAHAHIGDRHGSAVLAARFPVSATREAWALLVRDLRYDKATGLAELAARMNITAADVAVVGDWINDVPMFRWAGRSFAMGQSPEHVAAHATHRLKATSSTGGGVAEAVLRLLRDA
jgi:hypothetical protein